MASADDELLYNNEYITDPKINSRYGMTEELRKHKLKTKYEENELKYYINILLEIRFQRGQIVL